MFPSDPHAMRQLHAADMQVAHQRRNRGTVVSQSEPGRFRTMLARLAERFEGPVVTPIARAEHRRIQSTVSFTLTDPSTGLQISH